MKTKVFYWTMSILLTVAVGNAFYRSLPGEEDVSGYPQMSSDMRDVEYEALRKESASAAPDPESYFRVMRRFDNLRKAMARAVREELSYQGGYKGIRIAKDYGPSLSFLSNQYVNNSVRLVSADEKKFMEARKNAGYDEIVSSTIESDPFAPMSWVIAYSTLIVFTFGHFVLRIRALGGMWWVAAMSDWRFPFWLLFCPVGVFKYPQPVDVKMQLVRAYRFAALLLGSSITLAAGGCAGKRVKVRSNERVDTEKSWQVNIDTKTLPNYLGSNGAIFHPAPVQQSSATVTSPSGFYMGVWHSAPIGQRNLSPNFGREVDGSVGWSGKFLGTSVGFDGTWIGVTPLTKSSDDVMLLTTNVGRDVRVRGHTVTASFMLRRAQMVVRQNPGSGFFTKVAVQSGFSKGRWGLGLGTGASHDSGAFGFDPGWFAQTNLNLSYKLNLGWSVSIPFRSSVPLRQMKDGRRSENQLGLHLAWKH